MPLPTEYNKYLTGTIENTMETNNTVFRIKTIIGAGFTKYTRDNTNIMQVKTAVAKGNTLPCLKGIILKHEHVFVIGPTSGTT